MIGLVILGLSALSANADAPPAPEAPPAVVTRNFATPLPNVDGKRFTVITVTYPPGGASRPHYHSTSAFVFAYVLSGRVESQVEGAELKVYAPGESWTEDPGAHHLISRNASAVEPAKMLVIFVADPDATLSSPVPAH